MSDTITATGDGYSLFIALDTRGIMFELTASGLSPIYGMWRDRTPDELVAYIQRMLPLDINLQTGVIRDITAS